MSNKTHPTPPAMLDYRHKIPNLELLHPTVQIRPISRELSVVNANRHKRILSAGLLGNLISGMFFGIGCLIVEHIDNKWFASDETAQQEPTAKPKVANRDSSPAIAHKSANNRHSARTQSSE